MRIAMIGQRGLPATYGGVERHVEELGVRLAERGHEVVVFCRRNYTEDPQPSHRGVKLVYAPTVESKHLEAALHSGVSSLLTLGRRFDIVHYHAVGPGLWSPIPRWLTGAKVVQTIHGLDQDRAKWGRAARTVLQGGDWLSQRVPDAVIVVGKYLLDHYRNRRAPTVHIPNGVTLSTDTDSSVLARLGLQPRRYALFVGRLIPEKGVDQLIRAFAQIETSQRLVVIGGSSFTDDYELTLKRLAATDPRVVLPGYVYGPELAALFANASVYAQASLLEGLPLTVLEAASHGLPLVLSDIPAHREILPERRAGGRLYLAGDVAALSASLGEALAVADGERDQAREAGEQTIRRYRWETVTDQTEALYRKIAA
jgi:glycosyltransferase involved in cell wall biosynthesis